MALEKIEEDFGLLAIFKDAVNFYIAHIEDCKELRQSSIAELSEVVEQVEQMSLKREQTATEIETLRSEKHKIEQEFESLAPYMELIAQIESIEQEIKDRQQKVRTKSDALEAQEKVAKSRPDDELLQDHLHRDAAIFRGEKINEDLIVQRLGKDLIWYRKRFTDTKVDPKEVKKQANAVQGRTQKLAEIIATKEANLSNIDEFITSNREKVDRLEELKTDLKQYEADYTNLIELTRITSEVPFNDSVCSVPAVEQVS